MTTMKFSDLPEEMVAKILPKVPITSLGSVRSTCMTWEAISEKHLLAADAKNQFLGFILKDFDVCSMKFDLQGIHDDGNDFILPSVKEVSRLDQYEISQIFHCDGLLLCVFKDNNNSSVMVWNMYLNQVRWIKPSDVFNRFSKSGVYALGYDSKTRNHKILRNKSHGGSGYEIYDFKSDSWRVVKGSTPNAYTQFEEQGGLSLKGNTYFLAVQEYPVRFEGDEEEGVDGEDTSATRVILLCFDFTKESFGRRMKLPFHSEGDGQDYVSLSCVRDEKLAVLYQEYKTLKIWISIKLQPKVSWSEFFKVDLMTLDGFPDDFVAGSFFIDEEKHVAVVFEKEVKIGSCCSAYIIGQDGFFKAVKIGDAPAQYNRLPFGCTTAFTPSLVDLKNVKTSVKRKRRVY
ncbi:F-box/kelch-repeat protein [Cardamine amara subsp. amara]|uniref:F-box/kelch-repeat protein n=1 Tax=Cardamine amara subsp. amara TaxID=228776 RepID=A0ABD1B8F6_CARAN